MAHQPTYNDDERDIDLAAVTRSMRKSVSGIRSTFGRGLMFLKRNIIVVLVLVVAGAALGFYMDSKKSYDHNIIVLPNFGSVDYLYGKVALVDAKIKEGDTAFLKQVGIKNPNILKGIVISPVVDVYSFANQSAINFEMIKIMSEDGSISKVVEDKVTAKNYPKHQIVFTTSKRINKSDFVKPLMQYLNDSDYWRQIQKEHLKNLDIKIKADDTIIAQIDGILSSFGNNRGADGKLMFYNEDTQLNEIIKTKDELISEQGILRINNVNYSDIIKESSVGLNQEQRGGVHGLMVILVPVFLLFAFAIVMAFIKLISSILKQS